MARQHTRLPHLSSWEEGRGDNEQLRSVHILSLLYKKESDLALLFWLQPLQLVVLREDSNDNDDADDEKRVLELAWRLHLLLAVPLLAVLVHCVDQVHNVVIDTVLSLGIMIERFILYKKIFQLE